MSQSWQDLRYGVRVLARTPLFTATAVLSLALGIGINSTAFSVMDALFLRPRPGASPEQFVTIWAKTPQGYHGLSYAEYLDLTEESNSFTGILVNSRHAPLLTTKDKTSSIIVEYVSPNYFEVLGLSPVVGRTFAVGPAHSSENQRTAIISYSLWQSRFGGDPGLVGKAITLNNTLFTVIGVAPKGFRGLGRFLPTEAWLDATTQFSQSELQQRGSGEFELVGRLRRGLTPKQAQVELDVIARRLASAYPATNANRTFVLEAESDRIRGARLLTLLAMSVVGLVPLICCANVAGLLLARSEARRREFAVRLAMGAGRIRLARQLLTESAMLALLGCGIGLLFASWLIGLQPALLPPYEVTLGADLRIDTRVLIFTLLSGVATVLIFGLIPALQGSKTDLISALKGEQEQRRNRWGWAARNFFVVGEVALSVVLLIGAGLLARSFYSSLKILPGFDARRNLLLIHPAADVAGYNPQQSLAYLEEVKMKVKQLPGVQSASLARRFLLGMAGGGASVRVSIPGLALPSGQPNIPIKFNAVDPDYFQTVGTKILRGRHFSSADRAVGSRVTLISQEMARRFWPKDDPLGKTVLVEGQNVQVIGVVQDATINDLHETPEPYMYFPIDQANMDEPTLIVETDRDPLRMAGIIQKKVRTVNQSVYIAEVMTSKQVLEAALWKERILSQVVGTLGLLGVSLAAVGLYGVISYVVNRRRHELGVRIALGAQRRDILKLVLGQGLRLAIPGTAFGLAIALGSARLLASTLYGVRPYDPISFLGGCALAMSISLAASYFPARRAMRVDPMTALRYE